MCIVLETYTAIFCLPNVYEIEVQIMPFIQCFSSSIIQRTSYSLVFFLVTTSTTIVVTSTTTAAPTTTGELP